MCYTSKKTLRVSKVFCLFLASQPPPPSQWAMPSSFTRILDRTQRHTTVGRTLLDEWSARRTDLYLTTHNTHNRQTSMPPGRIRTHNLSRQAAADLRLRPRGHCDRHQKCSWWILENAKCRVLTMVLLDVHVLCELAVSTGKQWLTTERIAVPSPGRSGGPAGTTTDGGNVDQPSRPFAVHKSV